MPADLATCPPLAPELLEDIARAIGTPTYVYCLETVRRRYAAFREAFGDADPLIAFAVKANPNLAMIGALAELGAGADVASEGELERAMLAGVPPTRILFSGVGKTRSELAAAVRSGPIQINLESVEEARELSHIAQELGVRARVALRLNPAVAEGGGHSKISTGCASTKFGIPLDQFTAAWHEIAGLAGLALEGVAMHIGSQMMDLAPLGRALEQLDGCIAELRNARQRIVSVSVGGGLGIVYRPGDIPPSLDAYARLVLSFAGKWNARLILEPGRWLVGPAGQLLTRVTRVKYSGARRFAILDAGMNDLPRPRLYEAWHEIAPVCASKMDVRELYDVVGPVCETGDIFGRGRVLPRLAQGRLLRIADAGAYASAMAGNYNSRCLPAEVAVDRGSWRLVRRRQTQDDLLALELGLASTPTRMALARAG